MADKYEGKYLKKRSDKVKEETEKPKVKSQEDIEKVQAAMAILEKYRPMLEELSQASLDILSGTVMRPIHKKLEQIQAVTEAKKEMKSTVRDAVNIEKRKIEDAEEEQSKDISSEDLGMTVFMRNLATLNRTNFAKAHAIFARVPHTLTATFYALKGDEAKRDEALGKAHVAVEDVLESLELKNESYMDETKKRINTFNRVDEKTEQQYRLRENKVINSINLTTSKFLERNARGSIRRDVSLKLAAIGNERRFIGNFSAQLLENAGNYVSRQAAMHGMHDFADLVADKTEDISNKIIKNVGLRNKNMYTQLDRRTAGYDRANDVSKSASEKIDRINKASKFKADIWEGKEEQRGPIRKVGMKIIKFSNKSAIDTARLFAEGDMRLSEIYAKSVSVIGFDKHGKKSIEKAELRNVKRMEATEKRNLEARKNFDRVFNFKTKRKESTRGVLEFMENIGSEIETQRAQYQAKRRFKSAERKVNALEVIREGAQGVIDLITPSLSEARTEKVAAQSELTMNPEESRHRKTKENNSKNNNEGR